MPDELRVGSLFSGIGGFDLGFKRAGMRTAWMVELHPYRRLVLAERFPGIPVYRDVRSMAYASVEPVELICGGFPCTDTSNLGKRRGIEGAKSGLWREFVRAIRALGPRWVVVENVSALAVRGLGAVLADLAALGYDAEWDCIPAAAVGAPHERDRLWIVAYPGGERRQQVAGSAPGAQGSDAGQPAESDHQPERDGQGRGAEPVADAEGAPVRSGLRAGGARRLRWRRFGDGGGAFQPWPPEPNVGRVAHGVPARLDRAAALGDSLVPQVAEALGREIVRYEKGATCLTRD